MDKQNLFSVYNFRFSTWNRFYFSFGIFASSLMDFKFPWFYFILFNFDFFVPLTEKNHDGFESTKFFRTIFRVSGGKNKSLEGEFLRWRYDGDRSSLKVDSHLQSFCLSIIDILFLFIYFISIRSGSPFGKKFAAGRPSGFCCFCFSCAFFLRFSAPHL